MVVTRVSGKHGEEPGNQRRATLLSFTNKLRPSFTSLFSITSLSFLILFFSSYVCVIPHHLSLFISVCSSLTLMVSPPPHSLSSVTVLIQFTMWSVHNVLFFQSTNPAEYEMMIQFCFHEPVVFIIFGSSSSLLWPATLRWYKINGPHSSSNLKHYLSILLTLGLFGYQKCHWHCLKCWIGEYTLHRSDTT